jgi:hypothetical protein
MKTTDGSLSLQPCSSRRVDAQTCMLAHLCALVPRQRLQELRGEREHCVRNRVTHRLCAVTSERRSVLRAGAKAVGPMEQCSFRQAERRSKELCAICLQRVHSQREVVGH